MTEHRDKIRKAVAMALAPAAWAALGTGDTLAQENRRTASLRHADRALDALTTGPLFEEMARKFAHHMGNNLASIREKEALRAALGAREA